MKTRRLYCPWPLALALVLALLSGCTASQGTPEELLAMPDEELMATLQDHGLTVPETFAEREDLVELIRSTVEDLEDDPNAYYPISYTETVRLIYSVKQAAWDYYGREFTDSPLRF